MGSQSSGATSCNVCPDGTWTYIEGSLHADDCTPCGHANNCKAGATARITVQISGIDLSGLSGIQQAALKSAVAADIAATCGLASNASVWDAQGHHGSVSFAAKGIEAWVEVPQNSYANVLERNLFAPGFKKLLVRDAIGKLGATVAQGVGNVVLNLEKFHPQLPTVTVTTTATETATTTVTTVTTTTVTTIATTKAHDFLSGTTKRADWLIKSASQHSCVLASLVWLLLGSSVMVATS